jgi:hypothetical protein
VAVIVEEFITSLKVAVMFGLSTIPMAAFAGRVELTVGAAELPFPLLHPATKATSSNTMNHLSGLLTLSNLFICFSSFFYLIPKNIDAIDRPLAGSYPDVLRKYSHMHRD